MKRKKIFAFLLIGSVLLSISACGNEMEKTKGELGSEQEVTKETKAADTLEENRETVEDKNVEPMNLTYGNDPNNLYQLSQAPCFGEERVYYINFNNEVASFAFDGSDSRKHGSIKDVSDMSSGAEYLNWYGGEVYYMLTQYREDYTKYVEIRCMNPVTGEEKIVETYESSNSPKAHGMGIIGDHLFYACYDTKDKKTIVQVMNLVSGEKNELFNDVTRGSGGGNAVFTTDGENLYMVIPDQLSKVYRIPLSELYSISAGEAIVALGTTDTVFTEEGIYSSVRNQNDNSLDYVFYAYKDSGEVWPCEVVKKDLVADGESGSEEDIINNLVWYSEKWMLGNAMASVSQMNRNLYYSASVDYAQSSSRSELVFENSAVNGAGKYIGEYEKVLYIICQNGDEISFHTLTAEGTFQ